MGHLDSKLLVKARTYTQLRGIKLHDQLGAGLDGTVFSTNNETAVKTFKYEELYLRERDVYLRLQANSITKIETFAIPEIVNADDDLWIVEMEIVTRPYIVDFAGAYLDSPPPFSNAELIEWEESRKELFEENWDMVKSAMAELRRYGIYLNDVKPGNVTI